MGSGWAGIVIWTWNSRRGASVASTRRRTGFWAHRGSHASAAKATWRTRILSRLYCGDRRADVAAGQAGARLHPARVATKLKMGSGNLKRMGHWGYFAATP